MENPIKPLFSFGFPMVFSSFIITMSASINPSVWQPPARDHLHGENESPWSHCQAQKIDPLRDLLGDRVKHPACWKKQKTGFLWKLWNVSGYKQYDNQNNPLVVLAAATFNTTAAAFCRRNVRWISESDRLLAVHWACRMFRCWPCAEQQCSQSGLCWPHHWQWTNIVLEMGHVRPVFRCFCGPTVWHMQFSPEYSYQSPRVQKPKRPTSTALDASPWRPA